MQSVKKVVDAGYGVSVLYGGRIELPEVDTEPEAAVLLLHHDDCRSPGTVGETDDAARQHLLDLGHLHLSENGWVLATIRLAKQGSLGLDGVLEQQSAAQVVFSLADDVAELLEEGF